jgi:hypothetical protein
MNKFAPYDSATPEEHAWRSRLGRPAKAFWKGIKRIREL